MNTNDIELPPLPKGDIAADTCPVMWVHTDAQLQAYARAAIETDRKRQPRADTETLQQLNEVLQYLENEVMKLEAAYGHNFKPHATKKARATVEKLKAAMYTISKRRGDPVAWLYEDELPDSYPYDTMFPYSKVDGVRMFPVYAPQPVEPAVANAPVPSDDALDDALSNLEHDNYERSYSGYKNRQADIALIRALLARYSSGQPAASAEPVDVRNAHAIADLVNSADQATGPIEALHEAIDRLAAPVAQESQQVGDAAVSAIQFALQADGGLAWLRCWNEGDFDACRNEWPETPEECFIGADPLHPDTKAALSAAPVAAKAQPLPDSLIPTAPDLEYLRSMFENTALPAFLRGQIASAVKVLAAQEQPVVNQQMTTATWATKETK